MCISTQEAAPPDALATLKVVPWCFSVFDRCSGVEGGFLLMAFLQNLPVGSSNGIALFPGLSALLHNLPVGSSSGIAHVLRASGSSLAAAMHRQGR